MIRGSVETKANPSVRTFTERVCHFLSRIMEKIKAIWQSILRWFCVEKEDRRVYVFESLEAQPGYREELERELQKLEPKSKSQKGCLQYDLIKNRENPSEFAVWMCFKNHEAYQAHIESDFIADFE